MSDWIKHDGSDQCPIDNEVLCIIKNRTGFESSEYLQACQWSWKIVSEYKIKPKSIDDATPEEWDKASREVTQKGYVQSQIVTMCDNIKELLLAKNEKYGNSALQPKRIFSKASAIEQLLVRIDDKLSRIETTGLQGADEDTLSDLIGYLILLKMAKNET